MSLEIFRPVFLCILLAGTVLPLVSWFAERFLLKKASASTKHRLWTLTAIGLLCFPVIVLLLRSGNHETISETVSIDRIAVESEIPAIVIEKTEVFPATQNIVVHEESGAALDAGVPAKWEVPIESKAAPKEFPSQYVLNVTTALWLTGFALTALYFLAMHFKSTLFLLRIQGERQDDSSFGKQTRLWYSEETSIPFAFGIFRPTVVFPSEAKDWPKEKFDAVLLHELAHIARRDLLWQNVVCAACVLYWFHPFVWFASRRVRTEQELACDDMVLQSGKRSSDYASVLLELSKNLSANQPIPEGGLAMLRKKTVVQRIDSILDEKTSRKPISRKATFGLLLGVLLLSFGVSFFAPKIPMPLFAQENKTPKETPAVVESGIRLRFVDLDGKPIPKGYLRTRTITSQDDWKKDIQRIDFENGELFLPLPEDKPITKFYFYCYAEGFTPYWGDWDNPKNDPIPAEFTVPLEPAATIGGIVVDEAGKPVEGVDVSFLVFWGKHQRIAVREIYTDIPGGQTDAAGSWRCTMFPKEYLGNRADIQLKHADYSDTRSSRTLFKEFLPNAAGKFSMRLTLVKGITIRGKVVDENGKPIVGANVFSNLVKNSYPAKENNTKTDERGEFQFNNCLTDVSQAYLGAVVADFAPEIVTPIDLKPNTPPITLTLKPGRSITFRAIDKDGKGIAGAGVRPTKWKDIRALGEFYEIPVNGGKTNENGELVWKNAPLDSFEVDCGKSGYMSGSDRPVPIDQQEIIFTLRHPVKIACTAVNAVTGEPIPEFRLDSGFTFKNNPRVENPDQKVFWSGFKTAFGKDGKAEWTQTQDIGYFDKFMLRAKADGYAESISEPIPPNVDSYSVKFEMKRPSSDDPDLMNGVILTPDGKPAAGGVVGVSTSSRHVQIQDGYDMYDPPAKTDADGKFRISKKATGINDQDYKIIVLHDTGFVKMFKADFEKRKEPLRLIPWARIEGTLKVGDKPGRQMLVGLSFHPEDEDFSGGKPYISFSYLRNMTDENGKFVFDRVFPGEGSVVRILERKDLGGGILGWLYAIRVPYQIQAGETQTVNVGGAGRAVIGKVSIPADSPDAARLRLVSVDAKLAVQGKADFTPEASKDRMFFAEPLATIQEKYPRRMPPPDDVEKTIRDWEESPAGKEKIAKEPEAYEKSRKTMDGILAFEKSRTAAEQSTRSAVVDVDGNFRLDDLPPGNWTITAKLDNSRVENSVHVYKPPTEVSTSLIIPAADSTDPLDCGTLVLKP